MMAVLARAVADFRLGVTLAGCLVGCGPVVRQDCAAGHAARRAATPSEASQPRKGRVAAVADNEWRVTVTLDDQAHSGRALQSLRQQRLEEEETRESLASGHPRWEVRVELSSHHDAVALAGRLQAEGRPVIRRWKFLVLGANDEDDARDLARVIKQEAPAAASVHAEQVGPLLPFAQYGPIPVW